MLALSREIRAEDRSFRFSDDSETSPDPQIRRSTSPPGVSLDDVNRGSVGGAAAEEDSDEDGSGENLHAAVIQLNSVAVQHRSLREGTTIVPS